MTEREEAHQLANDYVNFIEDEYIQNMSNQVPELCDDTYLQEKLKTAIGNELERVYHNDEDHEETRIQNEEAKKWFDGDDSWYMNAEGK